MKYALLAVFGLFLISGCAEDKEPSSGLRERQNRALQDPFNYDAKQDRTDISGGGLTDFKRDAFKRDVNSAFNP